MPLPASFTYTPRNSKTVSFGPVLDSATQAPVVGATVTLTLRASWAPDGAVAGATNLALVDQGAGMYEGTINGSDFNPPAGSDYVTVIDLTATDGSIGHWEIPSLVEARTQ